MSCIKSPFRAADTSEVRNREHRSWLCPTDAEYRRMVDTYVATRRARIALLGIGGVLLVAFAPSVGWLPLIPLAVVVLHLLTLDVRMARSPRPEWIVFQSYIVTLLAIGAGIAVSGGAESPYLTLFAAPMLLLPNRFHRTVTYFGVVIGLVVLVAATVVVDPGGVVADPTGVIGAAIVMIGVVALTMPLAVVDLDLRDASGVDALTGVLNRREFATSYDALVAARAADGHGVAVVVVDVDRFKRTNDEFGHDVGDQVLRELAAMFRVHMRNGDLVCRLGGEEFAIVLGGMGLTDACSLAERVRVAVGETRVAGVPTTLSAGVAAGGPGGCDWMTLYRAADQALLTAKREGRDRVVAAPAEVPGAVEVGS